MAENNVRANISVPEINAYTYPQGPKGTGIKSISQNGNIIIITLDDGRENRLMFPNWWFGTKDEYNALSNEEKESFYLHFIEEGS